MEWLDKMNAALSYIEENLDGEVDVAVVAKKACTSSYNFQRMFSFIADVPLAEYIRRRRLSLAAVELTKKEATVLEVALKYGYESPVSFARAFQNIHGITPKQAMEEGAMLKNYPRISFQITIKGVEEMEYRVEMGKAFRMLGKKRDFSTKDGENFRLIPKFWQEVCADGTCERMQQMTVKEEPAFYGVCMDFDNTKIGYMVGVHSEEPVPEGFDAIEIPECLWVKFECRGPIPEAMQDVWKRVYSEWFPTSGYEHTGGPEIEWYDCEDNCHAQIWLPVRKCK